MSRMLDGIREALVRHVGRFRSSANEQTEELGARWGRWVVRRRWTVLALSLGVGFVAAAGGRHLEFGDDYRAFFGKDNPQLLAFEEIQNIYARNDNVLFVVESRDGDVFTEAALAAVQELEERAWLLPYATRVDALSNFQHTEADGDDLLVEDLVPAGRESQSATRDKARAVALAEPLLTNRLIAPDARVTGVNVTVLLPHDDADGGPRLAAATRELAASIEEAHPAVDVRLTGMVMLNNAFYEHSKGDMATLVPLMYLGIAVLLALLLRSLLGTIGTLLVIGLATATALGVTGWLGVQLTPPSATAPTMIMTLAVADCVHILVTMMQGLRGGLDRRAAIVESLRVNLEPVFLTSLTTAIGFLSMNLSDSPPFRHLGNITAFGVAAAFLYATLFLPALMTVLPVRARAGGRQRSRWEERLAELVIRFRRPLLGSTAALALGLAAVVPTSDLNDEFVRYFDQSVAFRRDTDFAMENLTGLYQIEFSLEAGESGGISEPAYLETLDGFAEWYRAQPDVLHVYSLADVMKRLNRNMHGDDPATYRLPESRELAAQYLLLYEMSLPYGMDLNDRINVDKSSTRITITVDDVSSREIRELGRAGEEWLAAHWRMGGPEYAVTGAAVADRADADRVVAAGLIPAAGANPELTGVGPGSDAEQVASSRLTPASGSSVMFAYISGRNIKGMLAGTAIALLLVSISLVFAFRSLRYGLLTLIPNLAPAALAFGVWALTVGQINIALSAVAAMTIGIVVDDTVHFMSKYLRARREEGVRGEDAVRFAFRSVVAAGFLVLSLSAFDLNAGMGKLTAVTIGFALFTDFLMLPPLLMWLDERRDHRRSPSARPLDHTGPLPGASALARLHN
jgi:predicted RND superfamily exporter protein